MWWSSSWEAVMCIDVCVYLFIYSFALRCGAGQYVYWLVHELNNTGLYSRHRQDNLFFCKIAKSNMRPTSLRIKCILGKKRPGREHDLWTAAVGEGKVERSYTTTPPICLHCVHREILDFYLEQTKLIGAVWQLERPTAKRHQCLGQPVEGRSVDMLRGGLA